MNASLYASGTSAGKTTQLRLRLTGSDMPPDTLKMLLKMAGYDCYIGSEGHVTLEPSREVVFDGSRVCEGA